MIKHISTKWSTIINAKVVINLNDGSSTENTYKVDDMVEDLGYVENEELKYITGRVSSIDTTLASKPVVRNTTAIQDTSVKDIKITGINIDASEQYKSNVFKLDVMDIVENNGIDDVENVRVYPELSIDLTINTEDGDTIIEGLKVGSTVAFAIKGGKEVNGTVTKLLYADTKNGVKATGMVVATEDKKIITFKLGDILDVLRQTEEFEDEGMEDDEPIVGTPVESTVEEPTPAELEVPVNASAPKSKKKKKDKQVPVEEVLEDNTVVETPEIIESVETVEAPKEEPVVEEKEEVNISVEAPTE